MKRSSVQRCSCLLFAPFLVTLLLLPAGCIPPRQKKEGGPKVFQIGMSQCNLQEPWRVRMDADILRAAEAHDNVQVIFKDAQNDPLKQRAHVEEFISAGVDLIIISPKESQPLTAPVAKAVHDGIPVIVLDRALSGDEYTCFIGGDNKMIGKAVGEWLKRQLKGKGKVVELQGLMTSTPGQERHSGFREAIADSEIEVVFEADTGWDASTAQKEMESALALHPQIDAVFAHSDPVAHGATRAAEIAGRKAEMVFVGVDALPHGGLPYVSEGIIDATFYYPTCGKEAIETALKILAGEEVPKKIVVPTRVFTQDNIHTGGEEIM